MIIFFYKFFITYSLVRMHVTIFKQLRFDCYNQIQRKVPAFLEWLIWEKFRKYKQLLMHCFFLYLAFFGAFIFSTSYQIITLIIYAIYDWFYLALCIFSFFYLYYLYYFVWFTSCITLCKFGQQLKMILLHY